MNTDPHGLQHGERTERVIKAFFDVYNELGSGFLEAVYQRAMLLALRHIGLNAVAEAPIIVRFRGEIVGEHRADLIVESTVLVELKAARALEPAHEAQLLNYLRATDIEVGLLLNFGPSPTIKRFVFDNARKRPARPPSPPTNPPQPPQPPPHPAPPR